MCLYTFAPQANKIRISSNGSIRIIESAKALCKGFAAHSVGIFNVRTVNIQYIVSRYKYI